MEKYIIFCTKEQTRIAFGLGAPIETHMFHPSVIKGNEKLFHNLFCINEKYYIIPTAEQMIGWLEEQETITAINIDYYVTGNAWACWIKFKEGTLNKQ